MTTPKPIQDVNISLRISTSNLAECMEAIGCPINSVIKETKMVKAFVSKDGGETIDPEKAKLDDAGKKIRAKVGGTDELKKLPAIDDDGKEIIVEKKGGVLAVEDFNESQKESLDWIIGSLVSNGLKKENFTVVTNPTRVCLLDKDEE